MFYHLLYPLRIYFAGFNVFQYITFRATGAAVTSFAISLFIGPSIIRYLYRVRAGERIRNGKDYLSLYNLHKDKEGTPTMGGILILISILVSTLMWADVFNKQILMIMFSALWLGSLGFLDDYIKMRYKRRGLSARIKFLAQIILAIIVFAFVFLCPETKDIANKLSLPFYKTPVEIIPFIYCLFIILIVSGSSNAVNLTDGLDGLATGCVLIVAVSYGILSYIAGHLNFSRYLGVLYIPGSGELSVFCAALTGAGLGFLWFNAHPAQVFMGDTGALALGGIIGVISILIKKELWLALIGGVFVLEALSVILQVASFKLRKKRIFAMAPFHHHFEMKGVPETKITVRFWIIALLFAIIGVGSLKLQ